MTIWKITSKAKKGIFETEVYENEGKYLNYITQWRWGYVKLEVPENIDLRFECKDFDEFSKRNCVHFFKERPDFIRLELVEQNFFDGVWDDWNYRDLTDKEIEAIKFSCEKEDNVHDGLSELGWGLHDSYWSISGPLEFIRAGEPRFDEHNADDE